VTTFPTFFNLFSAFFICRDDKLVFRIQILGSVYWITDPTLSVSGFQVTNKYKLFKKFSAKWYIYISLLCKNSKLSNEMLQCVIEVQNWGSQSMNEPACVHTYPGSCVGSVKEKPFRKQQQIKHGTSMCVQNCESPNRLMNLHVCIEHTLAPVLGR
jgi:hypothetical protein